MELREKIAKTVALDKGLCAWKTWEKVPPEHKAVFLRLASQILALCQAREQARVEEIFKWVDDIVPLLGLLDLSDLQEKNLQKKLASLQALKTNYLTNPTT